MKNINEELAVRKAMLLHTLEHALNNGAIAITFGMGSLPSKGACMEICRKYANKGYNSKLTFIQSGVDTYSPYSLEMSLSTLERDKDLVQYMCPSKK